MTTRDLLERENLHNAEIREIVLGNGNHDYVGQTREGLTPVRDGPEWYHVDAEDKPIYSRRFRFAGTFSDGTAPVQDGKGYFYIFADGTDVYKERTPFIDKARLSVALADKCKSA